MCIGETFLKKVDMFVYAHVCNLMIIQIVLYRCTRIVQESLISGLQYPSQIFSPIPTHIIIFTGDIQVIGQSNTKNFIFFTEEFQ